LVTPARTPAYDSDVYTYYYWTTYVTTVHFALENIPSGYRYKLEIRDQNGNFLGDTNPDPYQSGRENFDVCVQDPIHTFKFTARVYADYPETYSPNSLYSIRAYETTGCSPSLNSYPPPDPITPTP
jgi:hypothetical protein